MLTFSRIWNPTGPGHIVWIHPIYVTMHKVCNRHCRYTNNQHLVDKTLRDFKRKTTKLAISGNDYHKTHKIIIYCWIVESIKLFGIASNAERLLRKSMGKGRTELTTKANSLETMNIRLCIFQENCLSLLIFVPHMIALTLILAKAITGYVFKAHQQSVSHLLFIDDSKLYGKQELKISSPVVYFQCRMQFGLKTCDV